MNKQYFIKFVKPFITILILMIIFTSTFSLIAFADYDIRNPDSTAQYYLELNEFWLRDDLNIPESSELTLSDKAPAKVMGDLRTINQFYSRYSPALNSFPGNDNAYLYFIKNNNQIIATLTIEKNSDGYWKMVACSTNSDKVLQSVDTLKTVVPDEPIAYLIQDFTSISPYTSEMVNGYIYEDGKVYKTRDYLDAICKNVEEYEKKLAENDEAFMLLGGNPLSTFTGYTPVETRDFDYENQWKVQLGIFIGISVIIIATVLALILLKKHKAKQ